MIIVWKILTWLLRSLIIFVVAVLAITLVTLIMALVCIMCNAWGQGAFLVGLLALICLGFGAVWTLREF